MIRQTKRLLALAVAFFFVASAAEAGAIVGTTNAQQATEIDSCATISESGTYTLTEGIENSSNEVCIRLEAIDVTIDGNGHTIDGVDTEETKGIELARGSTDATIRDVTVTD